MSVLALFSRRLRTEDPMRIDSRYLATVRRAMSIPSSFSRSTILSSERIFFGVSFSMRDRIFWRTASDE